MPLDRKETFVAAAGRLNAKYKCFISLMNGTKADPRRAAERQRPTEPVTVAVKDCIDVGGVPSTWGSVLRDRVPGHDARVVELLRAAGGVVVATTNLHEFAFGGTNQNPHHGDCRNAWQPDYVAGGSSGGSAVAVALGLCQLGVGTDTGASVRLPASLNGVIGLRPTHGALSNVGVMPVSPPHDTVGFLARDVETIRWALDAASAFDARDPYSRVRADRPPVRRAHHRLGIATALLEDSDSAIVRTFGTAVRTLETMGHVVTDIGLSKLREVAKRLVAVVIVNAAEFHEERLLRSYDSIGKSVQDRIRPGLSMRAIDYARELRWLEAFQRDVSAVFNDVDFLIYPSVPVSPPRIQEATDVTEHTSRLTRNCWAAAAARSPAVSVPCGVDQVGIPIGLQIMGPEWADHELLALAESFVSAAGTIGIPKDYLK